MSGEFQRWEGGLTISIEAMLKLIERYVADELIGSNGFRDIFYDNRSEDQIFHAGILKESTIVRRDLLQKPNCTSGCRTMEVLAFEVCHDPVIDILR